MQEFIDNPIANLSGWTTVVTSIALSILEIVAKLPVNDILQSIASLGAIVFLYYKIRMIHLDLKLKKEDCKKLRKNDK